VGISSATFGRYELLARIGSGGMAEVFLAMSQGLAGFNKLVVLKRLRPGIAKDVAMITMFLDEARLSARLRHPNIVNTYEVGENDGTYFIAMEYLEGQPLNRVLKHEGAARISPEMWCHVFAEVLSGLHHAHEQRDFDGTPLQIVHRDLSPHNVFLTYSGEAKIVDFGVAHATVNVATTGTGMLKGKAAYMAPEQIRGEADRRSDIFTIGLGLWEALAGRGAYRGDAVTVLHRILNEPPPSLSEARPDLDPALVAIVMKAIEKDPARRYQTAKELRDALVGLMRGWGSEVRNEALGELLGTLFQDVRDQVAARVKECVAELATREREDEAPASMGLPSLRLTPATGESSIARLPAQSVPVPAPVSAPSASVSAPSAPVSAPSVPVSSVSAVAVEPQAAAPPGRGARVKWAAAFVATLAVAVALVLSASWGRASAPAAHAAGTQRVTVTSDPAGAAIERAGQVIGHTPAQLELPEGPQELAVVHEGFEREVVVVEHGGARAVVLRARLTAAGAEPPAPTAPLAPSAVASASPMPAWSSRPHTGAPLAHPKPAPSASTAPAASVKAGRKIRTEL